MLPKTFHSCAVRSNRAAAIFMLAFRSMSQEEQTLLLVSQYLLAIRNRSRSYYGRRSWWLWWCLAPTLISNWSSLNTLYSRSSWLHNLVSGVHNWVDLGNIDKPLASLLLDRRRLLYWLRRWGPRLHWLLLMGCKWLLNNDLWSRLMRRGGAVLGFVLRRQMNLLLLLFRCNLLHPLGFHSNIVCKLLKPLLQG